METVPCPISGKTGARPFLTVRDRFAAPDTPEWELVCHPESGMIYLSPRPEENEITAHYPSSSYDPHLSVSDPRSLRDRLYLAFRHIALQWKAALIEKSGEKLSPRSKILEIGCSTGELLDTLRHRNNLSAENCIGYEKDKPAADYARNAFGFNVRTTDLCDIDPSEKFDRIIFWHALEHLHRISETLETVAEHLTKTGVIVIALPNAASYDAAVYGKDWIAWDAPRHLYHFTPATLTKLLRKYDLRPVSIRPFPPDTIYNCLLSEKNILRNRHRSGMPAAQGIMRGVASIAAGSRNPERSSTLVYTVKGKG